jgi:hypothetical protein
MKKKDKFTYKVIDDFLDKNFFNYVKETITYFDFPWRRRESTSLPKKHHDGGYFSYGFFNNFIINSEYHETIIIPILNKLNAKALVAARANFYLHRLFLKKELEYHIDTSFTPYTAILNLTTCDGGTELMVDNKEIFIESKENRIVIFQGQIKHRGIRSSNSDVRYIINLNYF